MEAIVLLKLHHFIPVVVTNQPDVSREVITREQVEAFNRFIGASTDIQYFYNCFHDDHDCCYCRKPSPGLIHRASLDLNLDLKESYMVGDRWRDVAAGQAAGCQAYFIDYSYSEKQPVLPYMTVSSLLEAVRHIVGDTSGDK